jgi:anaerobic magnesium-protoporphyrin IX monomethyl ester cyclase
MKALLVLAAMPELKADWPVRYPILTPPLTLPLLAEICRRAQYEIELLDTRFCMERTADGWSLNREALESAIARSTAEVAGISFLSSSATDGFEVAALCKKYGKTVVGGGKHASVAVEEFIGSGSFDYVVQGEGEEAFPALLRDLEGGHRPMSTETTVVLKADRIRDLDVVPPIVDLSLYSSVFEQYPTYRSIHVETSRGCFKACGFCEVARTGAAWTPLRRIPLEKAFRSVEEAVARYRVNYLIIADSIATVFENHFKEFVAYMTTNFPDVTVQFNSTVDRWNEELAEACQELRCSVWFGFESGSQRVLDFVTKGTTVDQAYEAARLCRQYDIACAFNVLLGLPGETEDDYLQTVQVFERCPWVHPNPNIFNPLPGTALYDYCQMNDLLRVPGDYTIWDEGHVRHLGEGPVRGVDYALVLKYHRLLTDLQNEPSRSLAR